MGNLISVYIYIYIYIIKCVLLDLNFVKFKTFLICTNLFKS